MVGFEGIGKEAATPAVDLLSNPLCLKQALGHGRRPLLQESPPRLPSMSWGRLGHCCVVDPNLCRSRLPGVRIRPALSTSGSG